MISLIFFYLVRPVPGLESGPQQLVKLGPGLAQQHDTPGKIQHYGHSTKELYRQLIAAYSEPLQDQLYTYLASKSTWDYLR
jgi:hypothetical protein